MTGSESIRERITFEALDDDPYSLLGALQAERSVTWMPAMKMWFVTRRADVIRVLRDTRTYSTGGANSTIADTFGSQMLSSDGALHRRYKSQCAGPFNAGAVRQCVETTVAARVETLMAQLPDEGVRDLKSAIATPLSVSTICATLGIPEDRAAQVIAWYQAFRAALANFARDPEIRARGQGAAAEFRAAFHPLLETFRSDTNSTSLLAHLVRPSPDQLTDEEILSNALIVLFGGIETTESSILNCLWCLLTHPTQLADVREDPALLANAIDEGMRWEPAVQSCTRHATSDATLDSAQIRQGDTVQCLIGPANRDPAHFADPHVFDVRRTNASDHLSFGSGAHYCLGAALAKGEIAQVLARLLARYQYLKLADVAASAPRGFEFRAPARLDVELGTRTPAPH